MLTISMDYYGLDHEISKAIGKQAYLQVDYPYCNRQVSDTMREQYDNDIGSYGTPIWKKNKQDARVYHRPANALSILFDYMNDKIKGSDSLRNRNCNECNRHVMEIIKKEESKDKDKV